MGKGTGLPPKSSPVVADRDPSQPASRDTNKYTQCYRHEREAMIVPLFKNLWRK